VTVTLRTGTESPGLAAAIGLRRTNRGPFVASGDADGDRDALTAVDLGPGIHLVLLSAQDDLGTVGDLVERGMYIGTRMPAIRDELRSFVTFEDEGRDTAMLVETMTPSVDRSSWRTGQEWFDASEPDSVATGWGSRYRSGPMLGIIATDRDDPPTWIAAGRALEIVLLTAASRGLSHCVCAAPVEIPPLVGPLRAFTPGLRPQALLRIGIPLEPQMSRATPRRELSVDTDPA
jgi:hypothetical protein